MSTMPTTMTLRSSRSPWRRALVVLGYACLLLFAVLEVTPFLLTIANSFKCLPAVQEYPQGFIPLPPFGVDCRNAEGVTLPASALTRTSGQPAVWLVDPATQTVSLRPVELARFDPARIVVDGGIQPGDIVVTAGVQSLRPGQKVRLLGSAR